MNAARVKMPFFKLCFSPFAIFVDNFKSFFLLGCLYSAVLSAISITLGFSYICNYQELKEVAFYCSQSRVLFVIDALIRIFLVSVFIVKYYRAVFKRIPFSLKDATTIDNKSLKVFLIVIVFILINCVPLISAALLYSRVPNPDWTIEVLYFGVVSIGFLAPFVLMRLYSILPYYIEDGSFSGYRELWNKTKGNGMKIVTCLMFIFMFAVFIIFQFYFSFYKTVDESPIYIGIVSTFLYNLLMLMLVSLGINHCTVQKQILFGSNNDE